MPLPRPDPLRTVREHIAIAVAAGATLSTIEEELIDVWPLPSAEARDALWLYAWGEVERQQLSGHAAAVRRLPSRCPSPGTLAE